MRRLMLKRAGGRSKANGKRWLSWSRLTTFLEFGGPTKINLGGHEGRAGAVGGGAGPSGYDGFLTNYTGMRTVASTTGNAQSSR